MRFPERELKPYAEPVARDQLKVGNVYFGVQFADEDGIVPVVEPKVYIGENLEPGDQDEFYFQDYDSYRAGVRYDSASAEGDAIFETGAEKHVFEYERALDVLLGCSLLRAKLGR